ncbi:MAG: sodium/solute symporter [bacterium]|jgi:SSS family solute:Na+ symporter|nr:sodium/solute symporter [bacterium]
MDLTILLVVTVYFAVSLGLGFWVARKEKNNVDDYFLAGRKLPWYAISLSMTGSNIGTEHFIGMVGTAYAFGLAPAVFEWGNFIPYSFLVWIFLPYFYRKKLYTIPEFLERRYSPVTRSVFAGLTLSHMVLAVQVPALYAGGRIVYEMGTQTPLQGFQSLYLGGIVLIALITAAYCIYGGLLSVVWTDVLQVLILVVGGAMILFIGLHDQGGLSEVIKANTAADPERFRLIHDTSHKVSPWTGVATFWLTLSMWYVGTNQFYIQRCLGAKSEWDAKMGVIGCAYIKFFLPLIIVFPGLIAFAKYGPGLAEDAVYVQMINDYLHPFGKGILLSALIAAIMSTVSCVLNSASTIWVMDIHKQYIDQEASEEKLVGVGRWATLVIILLSTLLAPFLLLWEGGIFIYIQDMAAFFAPPISVIFLAAFFWKKAHSRSATFTLIFGIGFGLGLKLFADNWGPSGIASLQPLLNRAAITWGVCLLALILTTYTFPRSAREQYDADAIWNRQWARLPQQEQPRNVGFRNLMFWWIVLLAVSFGLFAYFG